MKVLWVNPSFLDYRVPVYKKLNELTGGNFYIIFSQKRVPERVISKIKSAIGDHAIDLKNEATLGFAGKGDFANTDLKLPYQPGLYDAISKVNADIVLGEGFFQWTPIALLWARLNKRKFIIAYERTAHTERTCPKWRSSYRKLIAKLVNGFSVNGKLTHDYLVDMGIDEKKLFTGGMSADSENLVTGIRTITTGEKESLKINLNIVDGITFLYVGQINDRKGVIYLLNAWTRHILAYPGDTLIVIGTGPLYDHFKSRFAESASIKLLGSIDYDDIYKYYAVADVFIIPTLEDNWSLVVPEAMACGLPIACSIYNGCYPELVHEGVNGKLFDPLEEESLVESLQYFHDKDLKQMGRESIRIEKEYDADTVASRIFDSINAVGEKS